MSKIEVLNKDSKVISIKLNLDNKFKGIDITIQFIHAYNQRYSQYNYKRINIYSNCCSITIHLDSNGRTGITENSNSIKGEKLSKFIKNKIFNNGKIDFAKINSPDQFLHFLKSRLTILKSKKLLSF
mgnify:CR=1 FL=1